MFDNDSDKKEKYPFLSTYTSFVKKPTRPIVGREKEMDQLLSVFMRPELCNAILLGEAGSGKTALVQGCMIKDNKRRYLEVDLSKMIADLADPNEMATKLKSLFDEVVVYRREEKVEIVLFIDEFHQIVQLSAAAVEALKPLLADSGTRGIRVVAATTYVEFREHIAPNQPLVERLQRINLVQPGKDVTIQILKDMAKTYKVDSHFFNDHIFEMIYEYTNRYIPANSQPRKSILILDTMVGWHHYTGKDMDMKMLADVIYETEGVNVAFKVDGTLIRRKLDEKVLSQRFATKVIEERLQVCVADLNDKSKPMSTFLFTGSTGVGKALPKDTLIPIHGKEDDHIYYKRHGDLQEGDEITNGDGYVKEVLYNIDQGKKEIYQIHLDDGRSERCTLDHLWSIGNSKFGNRQRDDVLSLKEILIIYGCDDPENMKVGKKYFAPNDKELYIPLGGGVGWPGCDNIVDPYELGKLIACELKDLSAHVDEKCRSEGWTKDDSWEEHVFHGAKVQRWGVLQGFFDNITSWLIPMKHKDGNIHIHVHMPHHYAQFVTRIMRSLGISVRAYFEPYSQMVMVSFTPTQYQLKSLFRHSDKAYRVLKDKLKDNRDVTGVLIRSIERVGEKVETNCIYIDDDDHLYQTENFVVTHNTEMTKQLAQILFEDNRNLIRFDMTEYANPDSLNRFREELTARVWEKPYSVILFDEIEKACGEVTRILLQVLDDGRLINIHNREVSFTNAYIVMTTNAGSEIYENMAQFNVDDEGSGKQMKKYNRLIRRSLTATTGSNRFPPELLGRIDAIVPFQPLSTKTQERIVKMKLSDLVKEIRRVHNVKLSIAKDVIDYLVYDQMDTEASSGGARMIITKIESELTTVVARFINVNPSIKHIMVRVEGDMMFGDKGKLISQANLKVVAVR